MKKILSLLSVLTITGISLPNIIAVNNYENKRKEVRSIEKKIIFSNILLIVKMDYGDSILVNWWLNNIKEKQRFIKIFVLKVLEGLEFVNNSWFWFSKSNYDYKIIAEGLWNKSSLFKKIYSENKNDILNGNAGITFKLYKYNLNRDIIFNLNKINYN